MNTLPELRRQLRAARNSLSDAVRTAANIVVANKLHHMPEYRRAQRVAAYVGSKGELDPMAWLERAHREGKQCFLPVLHPFVKGQLWFVRWTPDTSMRRNRFGIPEPVKQNDRCKSQSLDMVVIPLLGFDADCHRLGMGGGFYDRSFAFRRHRRHWHGPLLIGVAHDLQAVPQLPTQPWDISLDRIVTPSRNYP